MQFYRQQCEKCDAYPNHATAFISILFVGLILCVLFVSCNNQVNNVVDSDSVLLEESTADDVTDNADAPIDGTMQPVKPTTYMLNDIVEKLKIHGRTEFLQGGIACDFTASGIEFSLQAEGEVALTVTPTKDTFFTVWVDGVRMEERLFAPARQTDLILASFSDQRVHTIRVLKQTEAQFSLCVLNSLRFVGDMSDPPRDCKKYVEIIGDSIVCGHGILCLNGEKEQGTALYEDGTLGFAYLTAETLGADCSIVGCSGIGIDKGFTTFSEDDFYPKASYYRDRGTAYGFSRKPDLVVINLGTNDQMKGSSEMVFKAGVRSLIAFIREQYGDVNIVWTYNMMRDNNVEPWVRAVIEELGGEQNGLYICKLNRDLQGGNGHPTEDGHLIASRILVSFVNEKGLFT